MKGGFFIRLGEYRLIRIYGDGPERYDRFELYNLKEDISEDNDLSAMMPEKVKELSFILDKWLKEMDALMPVRNPAYNPRSN